MNSLKGIFDNQRPAYKRNFIQENVKQLRSMQKSVGNKDRNGALSQKSNKIQHATSKTNVTSKHSNVPPPIPTERAKTSRVPTTTSHFTASSMEAAGRLRSKSAQIPLSTTLHHKSHVSQINSVSAGKLSRVVEKDFSDKASKPVSNISSQNKNSNRKPLSTSSFSRTPENDLSEKTDTAWYEISDSCVSVMPTRNVGCQTVSSEDEDGMYNQGVIKYPSSYNVGVLQADPVFKGAPPPTSDSSQQTDSRLQATSYDDSLSQAETSGTQLQKILEVAQPVHERLLQRYKGGSTTCQRNGLLQRGSPKKGRNKEKVHKESKNKPSEKTSQVQETIDPACPLGHVPLPEPERIETLRMLRKSYEEHIRELNCLPVKTDTLKMRQRKIDLEKQLNKLEEGIKVFSRPKVFVKIGV